MTDHRKTPWLATLPGIITSVAALTVALTGLATFVVTHATVFRGYAPNKRARSLEPAAKTSSHATEARRSATTGRLATSWRITASTVLSHVAASLRATPPSPA